MPHRPSGRGWKSRITKDEQDRIAELLRTRMPCREIATVVGVNINTVFVWAKRLRLGRGRGSRQRTKLPYVAIVAYEQGDWEGPALARRLGMRPATFYERLKEAGVKLKGRRSFKATTQQLLTARRNDMTYRAIGEKFGLSASTVKTRIYAWERRARKKP